MKIAVVTDDVKTISQHFGRASHYQVITVTDGLISGRELRIKPGHSTFANDPHEPDEQGQGHGFGHHAQGRHARMAEVVADCEAVLCRGMGAGAYESLRVRNIRPIVTDIAEIDEAVMAYVEGRIVDHVERLH
jgi:predicted Fe-Mo cluster-binding NifX family protein